MLERPALSEIDITELATVVREALDSPTAETVDYQIETLSGGMGKATGGVYRLSGTALDRSRSVSWSVILKVITLGMPGVQPFMQDEAHPLYWKREALAYRSGLLDDLPGGVGAPRCYGTSDKGTGTIWLWLEPLQDGDGGDLGRADGAGWSLDDYSRAASSLGRFNGAYLVDERPLPAYPWLVRSGSPRGLLAHNLWLRDLIANPDTWRPPLVSAVFPVPVAQPLLRLWEARENLLGILDRVPETFCHLDAWRGNMFTHAHNAANAADAARHDLILIDWAYPGRSALGTDAGDLFGESFSLAELADTSPRILDQAIFEGYLTGLRDAGWSGDAGVVRFAFTAFCALKHLCFLAWLADVEDDSKRCRWERLFGRSFTDFAGRQAELVYYLLNLAREAHMLSTRIATVP